MKSSKSLANRFLLMGVSGIVVSIVLSTAALFSLYGKVGSSCDVGSGDSCHIGTERIGTKLAVILFYVSLITLFTGLVMRLLISRHQNKS